MPKLKVGDTPTWKSPEMCGRCNGAIVYIKDDSRNPFGTFKDRRCAALLDNYSDRDYLIFAHITSGNSGYSLGRMAKIWEEEHGRKRTVVNIVPKDIARNIRAELASVSIVIEMELGKGIVTQEDIRKTVREHLGLPPGEDNRIVGVEEYRLQDGYSKIIREIESVGIKPKFLFCPVGGGELAAELCAESEKVWGSDGPRIVGVTVDQNVLVRDKDYLGKTGRSIADKLVSGYSKYSDLLNNFKENGKLGIMVVEDKEIMAEYRYLERIGISVEPSSAAAFCGAEKYDLKPDDVVVIINTGKGLYDRSAADKLLRKKVLKYLKYAAMFAAGAAAWALGGWMQFEYDIQKHYNHLNEARHCLDRDGNFRLDKEEEERGCRMFPNIKENDCNNFSIDDLCDGQVRYLEEVCTLDRAHGNIEGAIIRDKMREYMDGKSSDCSAVNWMGGLRPRWHMEYPVPRDVSKDLRMIGK